jgi:hypothetical protein
MQILDKQWIHDRELLSLVEQLAAAEKERDEARAALSEEAKP